MTLCFFQLGLWALDLSLPTTACELGSLETSSSFCARQQSLWRDWRNLKHNGSTLWQCAESLENMRDPISDNPYSWMRVRSYRIARRILMSIVKGSKHPNKSTSAQDHKVSQNETILERTEVPIFGPLWPTCFFIITSSASSWPLVKGMNVVDLQSLPSILLSDADLGKALT